jgi:hypothetical protein
MVRRDHGTSGKTAWIGASMLTRCYATSTRVNSAANDDQEYSRAVELTDVQARPFSSM